MIKRLFLFIALSSLSYSIRAQADCVDTNRELHFQIISKEFKSLPSDSSIQKLEEKYFALTSLASCLFLLEADITDSQETSSVFKRVTDIALAYIESDTIILLTDSYNSGKVTEIFNRYAPEYGVRYISMGANCCGGKVWEAMANFNQQMESYLKDINGTDWKKSFHANLENYYHNRLDTMSRKERRKVKKRGY